MLQVLKTNSNHTTFWLVINFLVKAAITCVCIGNFCMNRILSTTLQHDKP